MAMTFKVPESVLLRRLKSDSRSYNEVENEVNGRLSAENAKLKSKLHAQMADNVLQDGQISTISKELERKKCITSRSLSMTLDQLRQEEERSSTLAHSAKMQMDDLRKSLPEEQRANANLHEALRVLQSSGADSSPLKKFLRERAPELHLQSYVDAMSILLKKILTKYPEADMKYFTDMADVLVDVELDPDWLKVSKRHFSGPVMIPEAPSTSTRLKRRRQQSD